MFSMLTDVPFIQEVSGAYASPFLDTDELKVVLRTEKFPGPSKFYRRGTDYATLGCNVIVTMYLSDQALVLRFMSYFLW